MSKSIQTDVEVFRLADRQLTKRPWTKRNTYLMEHLQNCDVVILNWDVINGDPEFGADYALRWFEHHGRQIVSWVFDQGGILIVEGQATLSVPTQRSYDAIFGSSELPVSGAETDPFDLSKQRVGRKCRLTKQARAVVFPRLLDLRPTELVKHVHLFPGSASRTLTPSFLGGADWNILYRGWFRSNPLIKRRFKWVALIRTSGRKINHDTMRVAKHGQGAIFVSTMFLASSGQSALVEAILRIHGRTASLPEPTPISLFIRNHGERYMLPVAVGTVAGVMTFTVPQLEALVKGVVAGSAAILFWVLQRLARLIRRWLKELAGW